MTPNEMFTKAVTEIFDKNFGKAADEILQMLKENRLRNQQAEDGKQITVMTIKPAIRIELDNADNFDIQCTVAGQSTRKITVQSSVSFNPNQPELNFSSDDTDDAENDTSEPPSHEEFLAALCEVDEDISNSELDAYFAGSKTWKTFAGWLTAGNASEYRRIISDQEAAKEFVELIWSANKH